MELIAAALGKPAEGRALVERVEDGYARVAAEHPEFEGKTATFAQNGFYDGLIYAYQDGLATADTIVFATERPEDVAALRKVPAFGRLDAVAQNRAVFTDGTLAGAMYFMTR